MVVHSRNVGREFKQDVGKEEDGNDKVVPVPCEIEHLDERLPRLVIVQCSSESQRQVRLLWVQRTHFPGLFGH